MTFTRDSHKEAATSFLRLVVAGNIRKAFGDHVSPNMRHHNVFFPGDAVSLEKAMEENHTQYSHKVIDVKRTLEEESLVVVHSHIRLRNDDPGFAAVHIFRFENDRIVEMWDIGQAVPRDSPNSNGMF